MLFYETDLQICILFNMKENLCVCVCVQPVCVCVVCVHVCAF